VLACASGTSQDVVNLRACDEAPVDDGTVRVKWYACAEEIDAQQFEARRGDVLLQSAHLSVAIRSPWVSLTRLDRPGGTLIDAAGPGQSDWVLEALPDMDQGTGFTLLDDGVAVDGTDIVWRLDPHEPIVYLEGSERVELQGDRRHVPVGPGFYRDTIRVVTDGEVVEDLGGLQVLDGVTRFWIGERSRIHALIYDTPVSGSCYGERVEAWVGGERVALLPADFDDHVPADAQLVCAADGYASSEPVPPGLNLDLSVGEGARPWVRVGGPEDMPAVVESEQGRFVVPPGGGRVPVSGVVTVHHGPGWSSWTGELDEENDILLERRVPEGWLLADLYREAMPSIYTRIEAGDELQLAAGEGVHFAVQSAPDEVGRPYATLWWKREIRFAAGSWAMTDDYGTLLSWPVSRNAKRAAHGAVPWQDAGVHDVLALARDPARRLVAVEPAWVEAAGLPATWAPVPDLLRVSGPQDLDMVMDLLDADLSIGLVGPSTWLPLLADPLPGLAEIERALLEDRSVASSGPVLDLQRTYDGVGPEGGAPLSVHLYGDDGTVTLFVDGELVATQDLDHGERWSVEVQGQRWALALFQSDEHWAFSAPRSLR